MKTVNGIEWRIGQSHWSRKLEKDVIWTLLCKAQDGQEFEIELSYDYQKCICCVPFGSTSREIEDQEINEVLTHFNS